MKKSAEGGTPRISRVLLLGKPTRVSGGAGYSLLPSQSMTSTDRRAHYESLKRRVLNDLLSRWEDRLDGGCRVTTLNSPHLPNPEDKREIEMFVRATLAKILDDPTPAYNCECIRMGPPTLFFAFLAIFVHAD